MIVESRIEAHGMCVTVRCWKSGRFYTAGLHFEDGDFVLLDAASRDELDRLVGETVGVAALARGARRRPKGRCHS